MSRIIRGGIVTTLVALAFIVGPSVSPAEDAKPGGGSNAIAVDPFRVPDGTAEELQKYIEDLKNLKPSSSLRPASAEFRKKRAAAQLGASEKILALKPPREFIRPAMRAKVAALVMLERLGDTAATAKIEASLEEARQISRDQRAAEQQLAAQQGLPPPTFSAGPSGLVRDVEFAIIEGREQRAATMSPAQYSELVDRLADFLTEAPADADGANLAVELAKASEEPSKRRLSIETYTTLGKLLAGSEDEKARTTAATMLGAARRLGLVGKPFLLQGNAVGGRAIDMKKYKGKVVLVDFFATWCGPCREEVPTIAKCYKAYRNRGFEVVAVSLDRDRKTIADFLKREKYPWTVLLDRYEARGTDKSLATYYGIFTIPQMILVGKDGRVLATDVRGERLEKLLDGIFGPISGEPAKSTAPAVQPARN